MPSTDAPTDEASNTSTRRTDRCRRLAIQMVIGFIVLNLVAVQPVLAQSNPICEAEKLPGMIEGFFQITTAVGVVALIIIWQADYLANIFVLDRDQKLALERHRRQALKSGTFLVALGPMYMVIGSIMGLPLADCINLAPW